MIIRRRQPEHRDRTTLEFLRLLLVLQKIRHGKVLAFDPERLCGIDAGEDGKAAVGGGGNDTRVFRGSNGTG
jgi:hypothetical protein